jgi:hypothetical protein
VDDLVEEIEDLLGLDDGDDGGWHYTVGGDDDWSYAVGGGEGDWHHGDEGGSSSGAEWYGTETPYEATSRVLAEQHATNLEVIDNIDGVDDYEYEVVTY